MTHVKIFIKIIISKIFFFFLQIATYADSSVANNLKCKPCISNCKSCLDGTTCLLCNSTTSYKYL